MIKKIGLVAAGGLMVLGVLSACGGDDDSTATQAGGGGGGPTVTIVAPTDGATITPPFTLTVESSDELGPTESGKHHVHLFFDGDDSTYEVVEGNSVQVKADSPALAGLTPGEHTMDISLRNADHSPAGAETSIKVTFAPAGGTAPSSPATDYTSPQPGY